MPGCSQNGAVRPRLRCGNRHTGTGLTAHREDWPRHSQCPAKAAQRCQVRISRNSALTGVGSCSNTSPGCTSLPPGSGAALPLSILLPLHGGGWIASPQQIMPAVAPAMDPTWPAAMPAARAECLPGAGQFLELVIGRSASDTWADERRRRSAGPCYFVLTVRV